jgi:hypothetical protein
VDIKELKEFLKDQSPQTSKSGVSNGLGCFSPPDHDPDASNPPARVKPDPDAYVSPDLSNPIKKELLDPSLDVSQPVPFGTRQIQEDGKEVLLILDSDSEGEDFVVLPSLEDGISSDTAVGDSDFGAFQFNSDFWRVMNLMWSEFIQNLMKLIQCQT